jgi:hypothetical protein
MRSVAVVREPVANREGAATSAARIVVATFGVLASLAAAFSFAALIVALGCARAADRGRAG